MQGFRSRPVLGLLGGLGLALLSAGAAAQAETAISFAVQGENDDLEADLRGASLLLASRDDDTTDALDLFGLAQAEYGRLIGALYAQGRYAPVISVTIDGREAADIAPLDAPASIGQIAVTVMPGPRYRFGQAGIAPVAPGTVLPDGFRTGEVARSGTIRTAVDSAVEGWRSAGYAKTEVAGQDVVADHATRSLDAAVTLRTGPKLRFGRLRIEGAERMRERRVRAIAGLPEGEVFDPAAIARSTERLRRTGVFRSVSLTEDEAITAPDLLGITATLVEERRRRYSFGAEVASLEGATISAQWIHRNLRGGAERLTIGGEVANIGAQDSGMDYTLGIQLDRPATVTPDTILTLKAEIARLDDIDSLSDNASIGFTLTQILSDAFTARAGLEYRTSRVDDASGDFSFQNIALPLGATWDNRDVALDATSGYFLDATVTPYLGLDTTDSGLRVTMDARAYRSIGETRPLTFAARAQVGAIFGPDLRNTPRDYLFYSGGGGTVRGQPYQSLGVDVLGGTVPDYKTGGLAFVALSAEVRARISRKIGIVGFVDAGHVGGEEFFDDLGGTQAGAGLGLRYDTGFGPIRLDVATPVSGDTGDGVQVYIGIGQSF